MFNIDNSTPVASNGSFLTKNTIHRVKLMGVELVESPGKDPKPVVKINFEGVEGGTIHDMIFPPTSTVRKVSGPKEYLSPSEAEQFSVKLRQYITALNPALDKAITAGTKKLAANDWDGMRKIVKAAIENGGKSIGMETDLKVLQNSAGYATIPGYIAGLSQKGEIYHRTKFIGDGISFTDYELTTIAKQANAVPTPMANTSNDLDGAGADELGEDDLNFLADL